MSFPSPFAAGFISALQATTESRSEHDKELDLLIPSNTVLESFDLGTGASIYTQKLLPAILSAKQEIILVTCFWAPSKTLTSLSRTLELLADRREALIGSSENRSSGNIHLPTLRIRICFSSRSLLQKLFHTSSRNGYIYPPSLWASKLGLPPSETLARGNIDMTVKSLFFLPFSVMHPKFLVIDRQRAFVPSCNVSWEAWLEGCLEISRSALPGHDPINTLLEFYARVWDTTAREKIDRDHGGRHRSSSSGGPLEVATSESCDALAEPDEIEPIRSPADTSVPLFHAVSSALWLPSSHHRNPVFRPFPWQTTPPAPSTSLNNALRWLFENAKRDIYLQTPDVTSPPVLAAIIDALRRGVDVNIVTSRNIKPLEQLLTAGTTTGWCIRRLVGTYKGLFPAGPFSRRVQIGNASEPVDLEAQAPNPGELTVSYYQPRAGPAVDEEPVHSHVKLSIFDGEYTVLGSGNMDRASWYTSQELGILLYGGQLAALIKGAVDQVLDGTLDAVFDSRPWRSQVPR